MKFEPAVAYLGFIEFVGSLGFIELTQATRNV